MRIWLVLVGSAFLHLTHADPITLDGSTSSDGKYFLTIEPSPDNHFYTSDTLQIRQTTTHDVIAKFDWGQFGPHISPNSAKVLWKPGSTAFALTWYMTRGWTGTEVYASSESKWTKVVFPNYEKRIIGKDHVTGRGKGQFIAEAWLRDGTLKIGYIEGLDWDGKGSPPNFGDVDENDWVFFRLIKHADIPSLEFVKLNARLEHDYDR
jgi:hypothetical protein